MGDANELQGLEDDGILESVLLRKACMKCSRDQNKLVPRAQDSQCPKCRDSFEEILPGLMTIQQALEEISRLHDHDSNYEDEDEEDYDEEDDEEGLPGVGAH